MIHNDKFPYSMQELIYFTSGTYILYIYVYIYILFYKWFIEKSSADNLQIHGFIYGFLTNMVSFYGFFAGLKK